MEGVFLKCEVVALLKIVNLDLYFGPRNLGCAVRESLRQRLNELDVEFDISLKLLGDQVCLIDQGQDQTEPPLQVLLLLLLSDDFLLLLFELHLALLLFLSHF